MSLMWLSYSLIMILSLAGALEIALRSLQLVLALARPGEGPDDAAPAAAGPAAFVSVYVATCNEPPER